MRMVVVAWCVVVAGLASASGAQPAPERGSEIVAIAESARKGSRKPSAVRYRSRAFAFEGRTESEVCPAVGTNESCVVLTEPVNTPWQLPKAATYRSIDFTFSHEPVPGGVADLYAVLQRFEDGAWRSQWEKGFVVHGAASSTKVSWDLRTFPGGSSLRLAFFAGSDRMVAGTVFLYTGFAREFAVRGTVVSS